MITDLTKKAYSSSTTVTNISQSSYLQDDGKVNWQWHRYGTKLRHSHPMYYYNKLVVSLPLFLY